MEENRITKRLAARRDQGKGALLPYFTAGFPSAAITAELVRQADALGAAAVEIGFPYSDSLADGPVIDESFQYVLRRGWSVDDAFKLVSSIRSDIGCGLLAMVSYSIVHRFGIDEFLHHAAGAGFDGVILPDLPVEEACNISDATRRAHLCLIGLVAPTTSKYRRDQIAARSTGFVYRMAVAGTTGERTALPPDLATEVAELKGVGGVPVCVGFGIATPRHVQEVCRIADGAIVGSALVRRISSCVRENLSDSRIVRSTGDFLETLTDAADAALTEGS